MDGNSFKRLISGHSQGFIPRLALWSLRIASVGYGAAIFIRNLCYDVVPGIVDHVQVPVVSVGNITTGGTGKTPVVALVAELLQELDRRPGIISRGYRAGSDGTNDEKLVLERQCPGVPHEQNASRVLAANRLLASHPVDVIVMDDGFQHRRLHRNLNIVLIDATNPFGYGCLLPRGLLREPTVSLRRADVVLITRSDLVSEATCQRIRDLIVRASPTLENRILSTLFQPTRLIRADGSTVALEAVTAQSVYLMSGIGNPAAFRTTCETLRTVVVGEAIFADHHHYTPADLQRVLQQAQQNSADVVLTTEKDIVKLPPQTSGILAVSIGCRFARATELQQFKETLEQAIATA